MVFFWFFFALALANIRNWKLVFGFFLVFFGFFGFVLVFFWDFLFFFGI